MNKQLFITRLALAILTITLVVGSSAVAQVNHHIDITGTVLTPLSMTGTDLAFGVSIFPGINKVVARTAAGAGTVVITGEVGKEFTADFTPPSELTSGLNSLVITFSATDGGQKSTDDQATAASFNPASQQTWVISGAGDYYVWMGGTVAPTSSQAAGAYTGVMELDVEYTGN